MVWLGEGWAPPCDIAQDTSHEDDNRYSNHTSSVVARNKDCAFVDFKKEFDRVWHATLWATMRLYSINDNLIRTIECLFNKATSAVYHNNNIGEWFRTTTGMCQGCLLFPTFFNVFLERSFVCWLLNVPATCECISGTDLHRQFYVLPH